MAAEINTFLNPLLYSVAMTHSSKDSYSPNPPEHLLVAVFQNLCDQDLFLMVHVSVWRQVTAVCVVCRSTIPVSLTQATAEPTASLLPLNGTKLIQSEIKDPHLYLSATFTTPHFKEHLDQFVSVQLLSTEESDIRFQTSATRCWTCSCF